MVVVIHLHEISDVKKKIQKLLKANVAHPGRPLKPYSSFILNKQTIVNLSVFVFLVPKR